MAGAQVASRRKAHHGSSRTVFHEGSGQARGTLTHRREWNARPASAIPAARTTSQVAPCRGPAVQPRAVGRRPDRRRVRGTAERRRRPGLGPRRPGRDRAAGPGTGPHIGMGPSRPEDTRHDCQRCARASIAFGIRRRLGYGRPTPRNDLAAGNATAGSASSPAADAAPSSTAWSPSVLPASASALAPTVKRTMPCCVTGGRRRSASRRGTRCARRPSRAPG